MADRVDEDDSAGGAGPDAAAVLVDVHACIELLLGAAARSGEQFAQVLPVWMGSVPGTAPPAALAGTARAFRARP